MLAIIVLVLTLNTGNARALTYDFIPSYINTGEKFTQVCTFNKDPVLSRVNGGDICMINCDIIGCNLNGRAQVNCSNTWIQVYVSSAEERDFGTWRCGGDDTYMDRSLSKYGLFCLCSRQFTINKTF